ncbi:MAG: hypothetical protein ACRETM_03630 [Stenotrophobium sp.]
MSVELPPPPTPQLGTIETLRQPAGTGVTVVFQSYQLHVSAANVLTAAEIQNAISVAADLSNAVRNLAAAAYLAGFPAAQVTYAKSGQDLFVLVTPGKISGIRASDRLKPYFDGLQNANPLTPSALEGHRVLASIAADREGVTVYPTFQPDGTGGQVLDFEQNLRETDPTTIKGELSNVGNRYASRYFLDLGLKTDSVWGDEFQVFWRHGLPHIDNQGREGDYNEQDLTWDRVTPYGVFGIGGRYISYFFHTATLPIDGRIYTGEVNWLYPVYADFTRRLTVQARADRTDLRKNLQDTVGAFPAGTPLQHQLYNSGEVALSYGQNFQLLAHRWSFEGAASVRKGFGSDESGNPQNLADQGYLLYRPALRLKFYWSNEIASGIEASGQFSNDSVPEQQQWVLGGVGNLTSSLPGVSVGDQGYLARLFTEVAGPTLYGVALTPKIFVEQGGARFAQPTAANGQPQGTQTLIDAGAELGFKFARFVDGSLAYAHAFADRNINQATRDDSRAQLYFRITAKF